MAKYIMLAVRDRALGSLAMPYYSQNEDVAKRNFRLAINDSDNQNLYPIRDDLELWQLGIYDDETGIINNNGYPILWINRGELVERG